MVLSIFIILFCIYYLIIGMLFLLFPRFVKRRIEKMKNYEIRLTGLLIIFVMILLVGFLFMNSSLISILRNLVTP